MTKVDGAVALVTGAAGGIGSAIADALAARGATVVRTDLAGADVDLDVSDPEAVEAVVAAQPRLDIAVTAAGIGVGGLTERIGLDDWRRAVDINLWGTIHVVRAVYPRLIAEGGGHLALVASLSGLVGTPLLVPYATSKTAVVGLANGLRPEAARHGIGVTAVCPGPVDTPMLDGGADGLDVRRYLTSAAGPALSPAQVGAATVRGIERGRAIVAPGRARLVHLLGRLLPGGTEQTISRAMRKELAHLSD